MICYPRSFSCKGQARSFNCQDYPRRSCHRTRLKFPRLIQVFHVPYCLALQVGSLLLWKKKKKHHGRS